MFANSINEISCPNSQPYKEVWKQVIATNNYQAGKFYKLLWTHVWRWVTMKHGAVELNQTASDIVNVSVSDW